MEHVKDVLWLLETGATVRTIMRELNVSPKTVKKIREAAGRADVHWKDLYDMTEVEVQERLFPPKEKLPDPVLERVVLKKTRKETWEAYCKTVDEPVGYSMFCRQIRAQERVLEADMVQEEPVGEEDHVLPGACSCCLILPEPFPVGGEKATLFLSYLPYSRMASLTASITGDVIAWCDACTGFFRTLNGTTPIVLAIPGKLLFWGSKMRPMAENFCLQHKTNIRTEERLRDVAKQASAKLLEMPGITSHDTLDSLQKALDNVSDAWNRTAFHVFRLQEASHLRPLSTMTERSLGLLKVGLDGHVQVDDVLYSVPYQYTGQKVRVQQTGRLLEFYDQNILITVHDYKDNPDGKITFVTDPDHLPPEDVKTEWNRKRILDFARKRCGEYGREYIEQILDSFVYEQQAYRRCMTIIGIGNTSPEGMVDEICRKLLETGEKASIGAFIRACKKSK